MAFLDGCECLRLDEATYAVEGRLAFVGRFFISGRRGQPSSTCLCVVSYSSPSFRGDELPSYLRKVSFLEKELSQNGQAWSRVLR